MLCFVPQQSLFQFQGSGCLFFTVKYPQTPPPLYVNYGLCHFNSQTVCFTLVMGAEDPTDSFKGVDWKAIRGELQKDPSAGVEPIIRKRLPKKIRQISDYNFLPRMPLPSSIAFYGTCIAGVVGAGILLEMWINKKVKEDGGIIWNFDK